MLAEGDMRGRSLHSEWYCRNARGASPTTAAGVCVGRSVTVPAPVKKPEGFFDGLNSQAFDKGLAAVICIEICSGSYPYHLLATFSAKPIKL